MLPSAAPELSMGASMDRHTSPGQAEREPKTSSRACDGKPQPPILRQPVHVIYVKWDHPARQIDCRGVLMAIADPILIRFRAALDKTYGARIERVVLFGSHA